MAEHKTADASTILQKTEAFQLVVGVTPQSFGTPRPDLNGLRLKSPNANAIYLIDNGYRRWIPNPDTYNNLFRDWNGVIIDIDIAEIPLSTPITNGAILARPSNSTPVYLVDHGTKRWITSPAVMEKYHFNWNRIYIVPHVLLDFISVGSKSL